MGGHLETAVRRCSEATKEKRTLEACPRTLMLPRQRLGGVSFSNLQLGEEAFFEARELEGPPVLLGLAPSLRQETLS